MVNDLKSPVSLNFCGDMICERLIMIVPTRPCINYSVSLEAVVWDGEQEDVFQYEPVRSKMIKIIRMMITYILGYEENSAKNL